jgi:peptide chain release factor
MPFPVDLTPSSLALAATLGIVPEDIQEGFMRGSGAGGQKINKTSSAVHLKHIPTGIEVKMQKHRAQSLNRLSAYKLLILKVEEAKRGKESRIAQKIFKLRKQKQRRSKKAKEKMLELKRQRSETKEGRRPVL